MADDQEGLAAALARAADAVEAAANEAEEIHGQYLKLCETDDAWRDHDDRLGDEVRHNRTAVALYGVQTLVDQLRAEAEEAQRRYPSIDVRGNRLPARPPSDDPASIRRWWIALSHQERALLMERRTQWVGSTDGIPMRSRHQANMILLDAEIARHTELLRARVDGGQQVDEDGLPKNVEQEITAEEERDLRGLLKIKTLFDPDPDPEAEDDALEGIGTPLGERFLYLLDAHDYPLKTAIVLGDLDAADFVALHVPGATTTVDSRLYREMTWMSNLRHEAGRLVDFPGVEIEGKNRVAIVDWIGYQAPYDVATRRALGNTGMSVFVPGEAIDDQYARAAAPKLVTCAEGIRAIIKKSARFIASGHSYGASTTGLALMKTDAFDAAALTGCPGLFTMSMSDFKLPPKSLYVAAAPGDVVAMLGVFGGVAVQIPGAQMLNPLAWTSKYPDGGRAWLRPPVGHEAYYNTGTAVLHSIAAVLVGDLQRVQTTTRMGHLKTTSLLEDPPATGVGS